MHKDVITSSWKGVITSFGKNLNNLLKSKRRNNAYSFRIIMPFSRYYAFEIGVKTPFNFSLCNLILMGFRKFKPYHMNFEIIVVKLMRPTVCWQHLNCT